MPVNFQEIQAQISRMGEQVVHSEDELQKRCERAEMLMAKYAAEADVISAWVEEALRGNRNLRCAVPGREKMDLPFLHSGECEPHVILAADGSQINPNRHDPVEYGVVNLGIYRVEPASGIAPETKIASQLIYPDRVNGQSMPFNEVSVALMRDLKERQVLAEISVKENLPVVALTDGPLELFREPLQAPAFKTLFKDYLSALDSLAGSGGIPAGYVDKPRADLVVRLLELADLAEGEQLSKAGKERPLRGITDIQLFRQILKPGQRSAVFGLQSSSSQEFRERNPRLTLHFFYINVSAPGRTSFARVEIPQWVAEQPDQLDLLHNVLLDQCRKLGTQPYPYALHRAHEEAVLGNRDREMLNKLIITEMLNRGVTLGVESRKQAVKKV